MNRDGVYRSLALIGRLPLTAVVGAGLAGLAACGGGGGGAVNSTPSGTSSATATATPAPTATASATPTATPGAIITPTPSASFQTAEYIRSTGPSQHGAITAWAAGASGQGVTIGIVDSGLDTTNPEFAGRISSTSTDLAGSRGLNNADSDHGTAVAQVAAAARNGVGVMGMAFNATIAAMRVDTAGSCATSAGCSFSDNAIAAGITAAIAAGAKVINLSLGGSSPNANITNAIASAASAGVVVVVSAGNDGTAQVDPFASGVRAAGNGNVIIAGSVGSTNVISSFSNRAGTEAASYLTALGEQICCQYENGVIKTTVSGGTTYTTVYNGTSFSAPQIAGAVALLRQAFPNLTAAQAVSILLNTATDLGATGQDTTYGRGGLDIAAAFNAQGATSLAGTATQMALGGTSAVTSPAMGDAAQGASVASVVLDSYGRAFGVNLANGLRSASLMPKLAPALVNQNRGFSLGGGAVAMAFSVDATGRNLALPWSGALRLSQEDAGVARVLAGRVIALVAPGLSMGFAMAQGADGLVASLQGQDRPAFMIAGNPLEDIGFFRSGETSLAIRRGLGQWGLTVMGQQGYGWTGSPWQAVGTSSQGESRDLVQRFGFAFDRRRGDVEASLGASWMSEQRGILGARFNPALGAHGADTVFVDAALGWRPYPDFHFGAAWRQGFTQARGSGFIGAGSGLVTNGWVVDGSIANFFKFGDLLALRVSQPLRVERGGMNFHLPVAYDYDTGAVWGMRRLSLAPTGREVDAELAWQFPLKGGSAGLNLFWRGNPGHYAALPDDRGVSLGWKKGF
ncbi:S8 family peptidase [Novosphingobium sediminicola]|uniref:Subtilisin family serine protease n=1 Tax=Novosphingobium sediminicola TaxID=563162 RepID=A0A7W6CGM0_9SPHN|nr:S8 family peptidase [Novosphingobium sediminicola]MBB3955487.1 subtilisin family serine protease [Novosphingobium sediminicola]